MRFSTRRSFRPTADCAIIAVVALMLLTIVIDVAAGTPTSAPGTVLEKVFHPPYTTTSLRFDENGNVIGTDAITHPAEYHILASAGGGVVDARTDLETFALAQRGSPCVVSWRQGGITGIAYGTSVGLAAPVAATLPLTSRP